MLDLFQNTLSVQFWSTFKLLESALLFQFEQFESGPKGRFSNGSNRTKSADSTSLKLDQNCNLRLILANISNLFGAISKVQFEVSFPVVEILKIPEINLRMLLGAFHMVHRTIFTNSFRMKIVFFSIRGLNF